MENFKIKAFKKFNSRGVYTMKYTTNGIFWKKIKVCEYDKEKRSYFLFVKKMCSNEVQIFLEKFKTLKDVLEFEKKEKEKCDQRNNDYSFVKNWKNFAKEIKKMYNEIETGIKKID